MKRYIALILITILSGIPLAAQEMYEGLSARSRAGEFPEEGYYAASSSFSRNSLLEVRNPASGESIRVIIVDDLNEPGIFLLLSREAADALGVERRNPINLIASPISVPGLASVESGNDLPFSPDPDQNPGAEISDPNRFVFDPGAEIPEVDNPLLRPDGENGSAQADSQQSSDRDQDSGQSEPPQQRSNQADEIPSDDALVILEELSEPEYEEFFLSQNERETPQEPAAQPPEDPAEKPAEEPAAEPSPDQSDVRETPAPAPADSRDTSPRVTRRGLNEGVSEIREDSIRSDLPYTGAQAQREQSPRMVDSVGPKGILEAITRLQDGSNAVSPDFTIATPDYVFWPPEYDPEQLNAPQPEPESDIAALPPETTPEETAAEQAPLLDDQPEDQEIPQDAQDDQRIAEPLPESVAEIDESSREPGDDAYAEELLADPGQEWIRRIRERYPERNLFLPPGGGELSESVPRISSDDAPLQDLPLAEAEMDMSRLASDEPTEDLQELTESDIDDDLPAMDYLDYIASGEPDVPDLEGLPSPDPGIDESAQDSNIRLSSPEPRPLDEHTVPLAQYIDPRPGLPFSRISAQPRNLENIEGDSEPRVAGEQRPADPLPRPVAESGEAPQIGHEPLEKQYGIEAGILRLSADDPEVSQASPPEPGDRRVAETESDTPVSPSGETEDPDSIDLPIERESPEDVIITMEEADFRSPEIQEPEEAAEDAPDLLVYLEESSPRTPPPRPEEGTDKPEEIQRPAGPASAASPPDDLPDRNWAEANLPLVNTLQSGGYYLQVGAFANPRSAKRVVEEVAPGYPLAVLPVDRSTESAETSSIYRVFVGPLNNDEKGTVLYWFRARGYSDAFIREGI